MTQARQAKRPWISFERLPTLPASKAWAREKVLELACIFRRFSGINRLFNKSSVRVISRNQDQRTPNPNNP
jgi:hypothetical protein